MPISVAELKPGDRVMLNCPAARRESHREAIFAGLFKSLVEAQRSDEVMLATGATAEFLSGKTWARFQLQCNGAVTLSAAFAVEPDGGLREDEGRRVFVERRLTMGHG